MFLFFLFDFSGIVEIAEVLMRFGNKILVVFLHLLRSVCNLLSSFKD